MFKVLLIVYVIGGGNSITYTSGFEFQEFHSMSDCELIRDEMKALKEDQTYKDDAVIPLYYATKCVTMTAVETKSTNYGVTTAPPSVEPEPLEDKRRQSRWND